MRTMEHPANGNGNNGGNIASLAWVTSLGFGLGMIKFFNNVVLADAYVWVTVKAVFAAFCVAAGAAAGTFLFTKIIKPLVEPWADKIVSKFKNKNKPS